MKHSLAIALTIVTFTVTVLTGCDRGEEPSAPGATGEEVKFGLIQSQRIDIFHEVENAILANERRGREEHPEGGPQCQEYIACLDDESKIRIAEAHGLTVPQLEDVILEGEQSGWSQW